MIGKGQVRRWSNGAGCRDRAGLSRRARPELKAERAEIADRLSDHRQTKATYVPPALAATWGWLYPRGRRNDTADGRTEETNARGLGGQWEWGIG